MNNIEIIPYSDRSIAVFSDKEWGEQNKDSLIGLGGRYNPNLTFNDEKRKGWIFSKKRDEEVRKFVNENNSPKVFTRFLEIKSPRKIKINPENIDFYEEVKRLKSLLEEQELRIQKLEEKI